jgi:hypothetical protein
MLMINTRTTSSLLHRLLTQYLSLASTVLVLFALATASLSVRAAESPRVGDFALLDAEGYFHHMSWYDDHRALVFLTYAEDDKGLSDSLDAFLALQQSAGDQFQFFFLDSQGKANREAVSATMAARGISIPVLMDDAQLIGEALNVTASGETLVFDPKRFTVIARSANLPAAQADFAALLTALADDRDIAAASQRLAALPARSGVAIDYPARAQHAKQLPSYKNDIAPIISDNCASCHREGGIAPFAMDSHTMVLGWSPMIREVLLTKRMPPGQIDAHIGDFINDMVLADGDAQKLVHWIEAGAPNDAATPAEDPLAQLTWPTSEWAFGEPDYIIEVPPQEVPATGILDYYSAMVEIDIPSDRWVRASQYIPGDRTVLHHTLHSIIPPGATTGGSLLGGDPDRPGIAPYIPGQSPREEPPNTGGLLQAGSKIAMQMHFTTTGKATVDESRIGVWFYPEGFVPDERMSGACACHFTPTWVNIPPFDPDYEMQQTITIDDDSRLFSLTPHMHFRGKRLRFTATYPDGSEEELINIANYNYNWQLAYTLAEPKFMPAGTQITAYGAFDNSAQNKMNPDPSRSVPWGLQSMDEMFFGAADWKVITKDQGAE